MRRESLPQATRSSASTEAIAAPLPRGVGTCTILANGMTH
jgi:hypothetical protein